jgi:hypothetical protein
VPKSEVIGILVNPNSSTEGEEQLRDARGAAQAIGQQLLVLSADTDSNLEKAFAAAAECHRALGLPPCLRHPLIDTFRNSPIDKQAKILCASHTVLAHRDVSRAVVPPLGLLHRRELRDHDSFDRSFTLEELEWPVRGVELDVEPHESTRHIFPIRLQFLPIAYTLANIDEIGGHRLLLRFGWMGQMRADQMIDGDLDSAIGLYLFRTTRACDN